MPLVRGTVESHKTPSRAAKIKIVISVFGIKMKKLFLGPRQNKKTSYRGYTVFEV